LLGDAEKARKENTRMESDGVKIVIGKCRTRKIRTRQQGWKMKAKEKEGQKVRDGK